MKGFLKRYVALPLLLLCLVGSGTAAPPREHLSERTQSIGFGISYLSLQKRYRDYPLVWKSSMPLFSAGYRFTQKNIALHIAVDYGRSSSIDINDFRKEGNNRFYLLAISYDLTWYGLTEPKSERFSLGLGLCFENFELRQQVSIGAGKYNEHRDEYLGIGPSLGCLWKLANGSVKTGFSLGMLFTLPYASQSITKTDGCYSDKAYIWWLKPRLDLLFRYRLSSLHSVEFVFRRDAWVYGRNPNRDTRRSGFFSSGRFLLNSFSVKVNRWL